MGKVSVGTGPCFCQWVSESRPWLQQGLELPPGAVPAAVVSHPLLHCSPASSLVALPLLCCSQSLSRCVVEGAFLGTWPGLRWYAGFPQSPALPADLLLAHCSEREEVVRESCPLPCFCCPERTCEGSCIFSEFCFPPTGRRIWF